MRTLRVGSFGLVCVKVLMLFCGTINSVTLLRCCQHKIATNRGL
jgi:hypothetical protein